MRFPSAFPIGLAVALLSSPVTMAGDLHQGLGSLGEAHETPDRPGREALGPLLHARDLEGHSFDLEHALDDGPVLLVVWFSDCPTCPRALLRLLDWAQEQAVPPQVVGVNGDSAQQRAWLRPFLQRSELELTVLADPDGDLRRGLGLEQSPAVVLIERDLEGASMVRHQPADGRLSMDRLARGWISTVYPSEAVASAR